MSALTVLQEQLKATQASDETSEKGQSVPRSPEYDRQTEHWCKGCSSKVPTLHSSRVQLQVSCTDMMFCLSCRSAGSGSLSSSELLEAMAGTFTDQVTVLKPLEVAHHDALWRAAIW